MHVHKFVVDTLVLSHKGVEKLDSDPKQHSNTNFENSMIPFGN